jgi:microcin C transport system substrate-binding protein
MIPEFSISKTWYGYWNKFGHPPATPRSGPQIETWWFDAEKAKKVEASRGGIKK